MLASGSYIIVTANPGCWMHVESILARMGERIPVAHTVQVLDASIRGVPVHQLLATALEGPGTPLARPSTQLSTRRRSLSPPSSAG